MRYIAGSRCCAARSTRRLRWPANSGLGRTQQSARTRLLVISEKALSKSSGLAPGRHLKLAPPALVPRLPVASLVPGADARRSSGIPEDRDPSRPPGRPASAAPDCLPTSLRAGSVDNPVTLPPGRARLATSPTPDRIASATHRTMGIVAVACLAARATGVLRVAAMTSTLSADQFGRRERAAARGCPRAKRHSIDEVLALDVAEVTQALAEGLGEVRARRAPAVRDSRSGDLPRRLRLGGERRGEPPSEPARNDRRVTKLVMPAPAAPVSACSR